jgi:hypothetical protein
MSRFKYTVAAGLSLVLIAVAACGLHQKPLHVRPNIVAPYLGITFGGGYVFAFAQKHVVVGSVACPLTAGSHYHQHPMFLTIGFNEGTYDTAATTLAQTTYEDDLGWDLTGYRVHIKPGGTEMNADDLSPITLTTPAKPCDLDTPTDPNNWFYVPDPTDLVPGAKVLPQQELEARMNTLIPIGSGKLSVISLAKGCFDYKDQDGAGAIQRSHHTPDGKESVLYSLPLASPGTYVDLDLEPIRPDRPAGKIRLRPNLSGVLEVAIRTHLRTMAVPGAPLSFFDMYYDLVVGQDNKPIDPSLRLIPTWRTPGMVVTPGAECPPVRIGSPGP